MPTARVAPTLLHSFERLVSYMTYFSYVVARDFGFAPNPFGAHCTLATCKPKIRRSAQPGDWVFGTGSDSAEFRMGDRLIFAMQVSEALTFDQYWQDERFAYKKPVLNGSIVQMFGDNIYHHVGHAWMQENSHHSFEDGSINPKNLNTDTGADRVLIATHFYYFGKSCPVIPTEWLTDARKKGIGERHVRPEVGDEVVAWLSKNFEPGLLDDPIQFEADKFSRYKGK
jgi:hypothetical protein